MSPVGLADVLAQLPHNTDPDLLVGFAGSDDAAVYRLNEDQAVVLTADIITPPVDDPRTFGRVAAANSLSDIYAMGGRPLACLNLVAFPDRLGNDVLVELLLGAAETVLEAGAVVAGGHTIRDDEPKFGLSVIGMVAPNAVWRNEGAKPGDALVLTKSIGSGVLLNAHREGKVSAAGLEACVESLVTLNRTAAEVAAEMEIHAATDVTGFGLAGHLLEMAQHDGLHIQLERRAIPVFPGCLALYDRGFTTGSNRPNLERVREFLDLDPAIPSAWREILVDPQTSGGLLLALSSSAAPDLVSRLREAGVDDATVIGRVVATGPRPRIEVT